MSIITNYCKKIESSVKAGNSTEHTHRPALKDLIESLSSELVATNEPQRIECGSPDFVVTRNGAPVGYIEAKDIGISLDKTENSEQLRRYRESLRNLILTNYLEFRLYRNGELVLSTDLGKFQKNTILHRSPGGAEQTANLLKCFYEANLPIIVSPQELAERMARMARFVHDLILDVFSHEGKKGDLHSQYEAFKRVLISELSVEQFADMYAQTIAYGLFAARCNHKDGLFTREHASKELPKTNPFLRRLFNTIAGADLDDRISWAVDDLAEMLSRADIAAILQDFGKATRQEDPVVHFYETFLSAYDPKMRELRGVYYTPEPVVGYIVRSVDALLRTEFRLKEGLGDKSKVKLTLQTPHGKTKTKQIETHKVQILDPACGTGTFLHRIVSHISCKYSRSKGLWPSYVAEHLLPRIYGFELLMAPYAVAHMKLGLQLQETGYDFTTDERLRVFLTNSLEEGSEEAGLPLFAQWLADEAAAASEVKRDAPIMVVVGNPPYSGHSANKGEWIKGLIDEYKRSPQLKKPGQAKWLSDDYVKFIRFAQYRIEQTGHGIIGFITNHRWLENPTFLDMRASLLNTFDELYILDLHGNSKENEVAPNSIQDENVFDIQQGVAISLFVRKSIDCQGTKAIHHAELWGSRVKKYQWLDKNDILTTQWREFEPRAPKRLFTPLEEQLLEEYEKGWSVQSAMNVNGEPVPGFATQHDEFAISWTREEAIAKVKKLLSTDNENEARSFWRLCAQKQWSYTRAKAELTIKSSRDRLINVDYRPFDSRVTIYDRNVLTHRRERISSHLLKPNIALTLPKNAEAIGGENSNLYFCVKNPTDLNFYRRGGAYLIPLYIYEDMNLFNNEGSSKKVNFSNEFLKSIANKTGGVKINPEEIFAYIYAILNCRTYLQRYDVFIKRDFPRIPLPPNIGKMKKLASLGQKLIDLHLMHTSPSREPGYPIAGDNCVEFVDFKENRVYINKRQYFSDIPENVWDYKIGGYQIADKWLKDRKGKVLTFDDLQHYIAVIGLIENSLEVQQKIDLEVPDGLLN